MATPRLINKMSHSFVRSFVSSFNHSVSQSVGQFLAFTCPLQFLKLTLLSMKYLSGTKFIVVQLHCKYCNGFGAPDIHSLQYEANLISHVK